MARKGGNPDIRKFASQGARALNASLTPEQRVINSQLALRQRWYSLKGDHVSRVEAHLRSLAHMAAKAIEMDDDDKLLRVHNAMAAYERMMMWLDKEMKGMITVEPDDAGREAAQKLIEAEKEWDAKQIPGNDEKSGS